jgi:hypothetical protein
MTSRYCEVTTLYGGITAQVVWGGLEVGRVHREIQVGTLRVIILFMNNCQRFFVTTMYSDNLKGLLGHRFLLLKKVHSYITVDCEILACVRWSALTEGSRLLLWR